MASSSCLASFPSLSEHLALEHETELLLPQQLCAKPCSVHFFLAVSIVHSQSYFEEHGLGHEAFDSSALLTHGPWHMVMELIYGAWHRHRTFSLGLQALVRVRAGTAADISLEERSCCS